jgi:hypothetical protein
LTRPFTSYSERFRNYAWPFYHFSSFEIISSNGTLGVISMRSKVLAFTFLYSVYEIGFSYSARFQPNLGVLVEV